jgi:hypothetical protein
MPLFFKILTFLFWLAKMPVTNCFYMLIKYKGFSERIFLRQIPKRRQWIKMYSKAY